MTGVYFEPVPVYAVTDFGLILRLIVWPLVGKAI